MGEVFGEWPGNFINWLSQMGIQDVQLKIYGTPSLCFGTFHTLL